MEKLEFTKAQKAAMHPLICRGESVGRIAEAIGVKPRSLRNRIHEADLLDSVIPSPSAWREDDWKALQHPGFYRFERALVGSWLRGEYRERVKAKLGDAVKERFAKAKAAKAAKSEKAKRERAAKTAKTAKAEAIAEKAREKAREAAALREWFEGSADEVRRGLGGTSPEAVRARNAYRLREGLLFSDAAGGNYHAPFEMPNLADRFETLRAESRKARKGARNR